MGWAGEGPLPDGTLTRWLVPRGWWVLQQLDISEAALLPEGPPTAKAAPWLSAHISSP